MESSGERAAPISSVQRYQVLRPGTRIIAQQFEPEPHPEVPYFESLSDWLAEYDEWAKRYAPRRYRGLGTSLHSAIEAAAKFDAASRKLKAAGESFRAGSPVYEGARLVGYVMDEISGPVGDVLVYYGDGKIASGSWRGFLSIDINPPLKPDPPLKFRNDRKPKRTRQDEPFYVSKTRRKRR